MTEEVLFRRAIVRTPAENFADGLTTVDFGRPVFSEVLEQHAAYCKALERCGLELFRLDADPDHPDSTFVEDMAVLTSKAAILMRPGASSRLGEVTSIRTVVEHLFRKRYEIKPPGTVDGGDICDAGSHFFIGVSQRTNEEGARQLNEILAAEGYTSSVVDIRGMHSILHLKSGIAYLNSRRLVVMEEMAGWSNFQGYELVRVPADESYACNCVMINDHVLVSAGFPWLRSTLLELGYKPIVLNVSEFRKMDGGLSCLSLRF